MAAAVLDLPGGAVADGRGSFFFWQSVRLTTTARFIYRASDLRTLHNPNNCRRCPKRQRRCQSHDFLGTFFFFATFSLSFCPDSAARFSSTYTARTLYDNCTCARALPTSEICPTPRTRSSSTEHLC